MDIMLPTLRAERAATYSPVLPISPRTGKVLQVPVEVIDVTGRRWQTLLAAQAGARVPHRDIGDDDLLSLTYVYDAFFAAGPDLSYSYGLWSGQRRRGWWRWNARSRRMSTVGKSCIWWPPSGGP